MARNQLRRFSTPWAKNGALKKETSDRGDESGRWQMAGEPRLGVIQGQTVTALPRKILDRYRLSLGEGAGTAHCMTACTRRVISSASS